MGKPAVYDNCKPATNSSVSGKAPGSAPGAGGKAKARYPHAPLGPGQKGGGGGIKHRAYTPGTTPTGS